MIFSRINSPNFVQAYRYDTCLERSDGMIFTRPGKCRYGVPPQTVPLRALDTPSRRHESQLTDRSSHQQWSQLTDDDGQHAEILLCLRFRQFNFVVSKLTIAVGDKIIQRVHLSASRMHVAEAATSPGSMSTTWPVTTRNCEMVLKTIKSFGLSVRMPRFETSGGIKLKTGKYALIWEMAI